MNRHPAMPEFEMTAYDCEANPLLATALGPDPWDLPPAAPRPQLPTDTEPPF